VLPLLSRSPVMTALAAYWVPALNAALLDPIMALQHE
jgi:hypothetical protein